jgi:hypothetical protein
MNVEDIMNKICDIEYMNRTNFSKEFDLACSKKDKLKVLNLIVEKYDCNFEDAQAICDYFIDGKPLPNPDLTPQQIAQANAQAQDWLNKVHCPYCNSTNCKKISGVSKATSVAMFGIFSQKVKKQWHCNNCKSDF